MIQIMNKFMNKGFKAVLCTGTNDSLKTSDCKQKLIREQMIPICFWTGLNYYLKRSDSKSDSFMNKWFQFVYELE